MFHHHQSFVRISVFLLLATVPILATWSFSPVHASSPISFETSAKVPLLISASSTTITVTTVKMDAIVVEVFTTFPGKDVSSITDTQSNPYTFQVENDVVGPITLEFWTATATAAGSDTLTITLSNTANFGVMVGLYANVASFATSAAWQGRQQGLGTSAIIVIPPISTVGLAGQAANDWWVGGMGENPNHGQTTTCLGLIGSCKGSLCSQAQGCLNQVQRQVDLSSAPAADFEDTGGPVAQTFGVQNCSGYQAGINGWCWGESYAHGNPGGETALDVALDLVCCGPVASIPSTSINTPPNNTGNGYYLAGPGIDYVQVTIGGSVLVVGLALIFKRRTVTT